jgi:hypothetical protein
MILISCALITTDERNVLRIYDCTCILCSIAILIECTYGKNSFYDYVIFIL